MEQARDARRVPGKLPRDGGFRQRRLQGKERERQDKQRNHDERRAHHRGRERSPKVTLPSYKLRAPEADGPEPKGEAEKLASPLTFTPLSGP